MKNTSKVLFLTLVMMQFTPAVAEQPFGGGERTALTGNSNKFYFSIFGGEALSGKKLSGQGYEDAPKRPKASNVYGVGLGYYLDDQFRGDVTLTQFQGFNYKAHFSELDGASQLNWAYTQNIKSTLLAANFYYDLINQNNIIPYITGGIGVARNRVGTFYASASNGTDPIYNPNAQHSYTLPGKTKYNFAWSVGGGVSYKASDAITWDVINYKYHDLGKIATRDGMGILGNPVDHAKSRLSAHSITTGVRIHFDFLK